MTRKTGIRGQASGIKERALQGDLPHPPMPDASPLPLHSAPHIPVMLAEVLAALAVTPDGHYIDATFGCGGYSRAILEQGCRQLDAFDRDPAASPIAEALQQEFPGRFRFHALPFSRMAEVLPAGSIDGIAFDLGVSSPQLDIPARGFSFRTDGPLDMRMSQSGRTAADLINFLSDSELADIIYLLGEERKARSIARAIVRRRAETPYTTTFELAATVRACVPPSRDGIDPATRTFQALRLAVNGELDELTAGLAAAETLLAADGRLAVVAFHSLEDRIVKDFCRTRARPPQPSRHLPVATLPTAATFTLPHAKALRPTDAECAANPRARSARLRVAAKKGKTPIQDAPHA